MEKFVPSDYGPSFECKCHAEETSDYIQVNAREDSVGR